MAAARSIRDRLTLAIRQRRELLGLTQEEAAARSELSPRYWRKLESEEEAPAVSMEVVEQVLNGLNWSWSELIAALSERGDRARRDDDDSDTAVNLLRAAWKRATPREREMVSALLQVVARRRSK